MNKTIILSDKQKKLVDERVQSGSYTSESDVIAESLHLLEMRDNYVREKALAGLNSGKSIPAEEVFARMEKKLEKRANEQR